MDAYGIGSLQNPGTKYDIYIYIYTSIYIYICPSSETGSPFKPTGGRKQQETLLSKWELALAKVAPLKHYHCRVAMFPVDSLRCKQLEDKVSNLQLDGLHTALTAVFVEPVWPT